MPGTGGQAPRRSPALGLALAGIVFVVVIGVVLALVSWEPEPEVATTPVEVAGAFMAALNAHDVEAVLAMLTEDATHDHESIETLRGEIELQRILGWAYKFDKCVEVSSTTFRCPYEFSTEVSRAIGVEPYGGSYLVLTVSDGMISRWHQQENDSGWPADALPAFGAWMEANHQEDVDNIFFHYGGRPETLALWEEYLPEFVAAMSSN